MRIALVAHDARKQELVEWCTHNAQTLSKHTLFGTGTTARLLREIPIKNEHCTDNTSTMDSPTMKLQVEALLSGPLGGDQQIGAMIAEGKIDCLIFFCDNLITQGHQQDVGALVRLASLYNVAFATNRTTADMIMTSPLFGNENYKPIMPGAIDRYKNRFEEREEPKQDVDEIGDTPDEKVQHTVAQDMWNKMSEAIKDKISTAKEQGLCEVDLGEMVLVDEDKDVLRTMGYTIVTNGNAYTIRWVNNGN